MKKSDKKTRAIMSGFTLVEMLVVMAILAVLIGIAVAGIGFALRRSRNIARQAAAANLDRALEAYYSDEQIYPVADFSFTDMVEEDDDAAENYTLYPYLEGSWDSPPISTFGYTSQDGLLYSVCVSQEESGNEFSWRCYGPGVDFDDAVYPHAEYTPDEALDCAVCGDMVGCVDEEGLLGDGCCTQHAEICPPVI